MSDYETEDRVFNPSKYIPPTKWLVDNLIPINSLSFVLSQAGVGKSWFVESLATCISHNTKFLNRDVLDGDVLIIDQDTPEDVLSRRLKKFSYGRKSKNNLYVESMKGYTINDKLVDLINNDYNDVRLVVIDSLHSLLGHINPNDTKEMDKLSLLKQNILNDLNRDISIIITHHTSEKVIATLDETMTSQTFGLFTMGSSVINQVADNIYFLASPDKGAKLRRLYLRPVAKRFEIDTDPMKILLMEDDGIYLKYDGLYEKDDEVEKRIIETLRYKSPRFHTTKQIYDDIGLYSVNVIRETLRKMIAEKKVKFYVTNKNLHMFSLPETKIKTRSNELRNRIISVMTNKPISVNDVHDKIKGYGVKAIRNELNELVDKKKIDCYFGEHGLHTFVLHNSKIIKIERSSPKNLDLEKDS